MATVREDVVKMSFDIDMAELTKMVDALDEVKRILTSGIGDDAFDEMTRDSKQAADGIDGIKDSLNGIKPDGLDDTVKGLKDTDKKADDAHEGLKKIANQTFDKTVSGLKSVVSTLGKVGIAAGKLLAKGLVAGAAGVGTIVGQSVSSYADYEQLVGGVDTLFKGSSKTVQNYAANAYKTAGLSANDYMETVTSFSASLIQGLGGDTAAATESAHMAIVDMADNANKMGTSIGSIQDAYQGFAKDNYTMLDNLKLGYGGTQGEMARLINDTGVLGKNTKVTAETVKDVPFDKIIEAIHKVQENLGITGTTSKEAADTISGSFSALKASWSNMLTGLIRGGDEFDRCIENLVESAKTFGKNVMPAITKALEGFGELIEELAPIVEKELPGIIDSLLPPLIRAAASLIRGLIAALPDIVGALVDELPNVLQQVWAGIKEAFGDVPGMGKVEGFFGKLKDVFVKNAGTIKKVVGVALGLMAAIKIFNKVKGAMSIFGGGGAGGGGGGMFSMFDGLAKLKPTAVLKGMLNLAIILGGIGILAAALMAAAPYMAQLSDLKSIGEVLLAIGAVGLLGAELTKISAPLGNIPVATVAKGLANIAIVLVGFGALAAVLMWVAPYMAQLSDLKTTMEILLVIGAVGLVGAALAALAGFIGAIPIALVLSGLANIALALGGFAAIATAFGALTKVEGFTELLNSGGQVLADICGIIGDMAGSLIGSFAEGVTDSLPAIGENLSSFATSLQPMFDTFAGVDTAGLGEFANALAAFIGVIAGEKIVGIITGGIDYADLGTKLSTMATSLSGFFSTIMTFPEGGFEKATALFDCLAGISSLPKEGGVVGWFQGEVDFATMATGLAQLATTASFFTAIQAIPDEAFTKATALFDCLAGIKSLPKDGGVTGWFQGEVNFATIASGIQSLASAGMVTALTTLSTIPETAFTSLTAMFDALAGIKAMPKEGGIAGWFSGDSSTGLVNVASQLPGVATNIASFFSNLGGRTDFTPIKSLFDTLSGIEISSDAAEGTGLFGMGASQLESMGQGLADFASAASGFFTAINGLNLANLTGFFNQLSTMGQLPLTLTQLDITLGMVLTNIVTTAKSKISELNAAIVEGTSEVISTLNAMVPQFIAAGEAIMAGVNVGMNNMRGTLLATAASIASEISSTLSGALQIASPSRVTTRMGEFVGEGLAIGMQKTIPAVQLAANDLGTASIPYSSAYTPESSSYTTYNSGGNSEYTTISPTFNLTVSGSQDDRTLARKVKRFVSEAINETFESFERKSYVVREA